jgi:hypothetical protein
LIKNHRLLEPQVKLLTEINKIYEEGPSFTCRNRLMSRGHSSFSAHRQEDPFQNEQLDEIIKLNKNNRGYMTKVDNLKAKFGESLGVERSFSSFRTTLKEKVNKPPRPPPPQTSISNSYSRISNNDRKSNFHKSVSSYSQVEHKDLKKVLGEDE